MLSTLMIRIMARERGLKVLAIDADSAVSLAYTLGASGAKSLSDVRTELINDPDARKKAMGSHIRDVVAGMLQSRDGFDLLVMGRPEGPGCFCSLNDLLRYGIETLSGEYDVTIVDGEAGPEQINRRVMRSIDHLVILTDTSARGFRTAEVIGAIAGSGGTTNLKQSGLVINRLTANSRKAVEAAENLNQEIFGTIPEDQYVTDHDLSGAPILELPDIAPSVDAVRQIVAKIGLS